MGLFDFAREKLTAVTEVLPTDVVDQALAVGESLTGTDLSGVADAVGQGQGVQDIAVDAASGTVYIADENNTRVRFFGAASATATASSATASVSATSTSTPTPTPTVTGTPSSTRTASVTPTTTASGAPTPPRSGTPTPTSTMTPPPPAQLGVPLCHVATNAAAYWSADGSVVLTVRTWADGLGSTGT